MKLIKVEFISYKSITGDTLDIESDITCLVGVNESGKSNVLLALEKADTNHELTVAEISRHSEDYGDPNKTPQLILVFMLDDKEKMAIGEIIGSTEIDMLVFTKNGKNYSLDSPSINYKESKFFSLEASPEALPSENGQPATEKENQKVVKQKAIEDEDISEEQQQDIREKVLHELVNRLPRFLRFDSVNFEEHYLPQNGEVIISQFIAEPDKFKLVKNLLYLGGIADYSKLQANNFAGRILRDTVLQRASKIINKNILRAIWPIETVEIHLDAEGDILKIRLKEKNKTSFFMPGERSRGLQWTLAFNIYFIAETQQELSNCVFLIDEPGIFLHIDGQRKLLEETFPQICRENNQVVYTSHLPYMIDSRYPERIRILEKKDEDTIIGNKSWSEGEFGKIPEPVRTALGLEWTKIFQFDEQNIIVEGPSDQIIYRILNDKINTQQNDVVFLPSYGADKMPAVLAMAKLDDKKAVGIIDGDMDINKLREKCKLVSLPGKSLESISKLAGDVRIKTVEDLLPGDVFQKAIFTVYEPICRKRRNCHLTIDEIPTDLPRVKNLNRFFADKFGAKKHNLRKMEIARALINLIDEESDSKWDSVKKFIQEINSLFSV